MDDEVEKILGWRLASFLLDVCRESPADQVSFVTLFAAYRQWCDEHQAVPYAEGTFVDEIGRLCEECEMPIKQSGGNIWMLGLRLANGYGETE